ncbi:NAD(P)H dehydrogenase (quinone) [Sphingomonas glacialis]|uniref:NAD(P)H dehydrogenase (Quinone) n=1 Tax=Sphingomonas glacialis TaxID=658225 RepID=A0ABQ3L7P8_9SPHN|nr:NAD(P)H-dependent oxidoreductase [Sphingomonas glacialis]GHH07820.1 NAD(P)H dehydrogenase (quinone) [Sphingomonas glacialis]
MPDTRSKPPRHVVILCHPEQDSFNAAMAAAYSATVREQGHEVIVRDLYAIGFHPVLKSAERPGPGERQFADVAEELAVLKDSDVFVLVYPIWFGGPPAMLKGYVERVLGSGVLPDAVYEGTAKGVLAGKQLLSFTTSGLKEIWLDEMGQLRALTQAFDHYIEHAFAMAPSRHVHFGHITPDMEPGWARRHLEEVRGQARAIVRALDGLVVAE